MSRHLSVATALLTATFTLMLAAGGVMAAEKKVTRYARFEVGGKVSYGIVEGDQVRRIEGDLFGTWKPTEQTFPLSRVKLLVPSEPTKVLACAGNYKSHLGAASPHPHPELFFKVPSCLIAVVEVALEGVGVLKNTVTAAK